MKKAAHLQKPPGDAMFRQYGEAPWKAIVLHGGPGAPGCAAGLCRRLSECFGVVEHLQRAKSIDGLLAEISGVMDACHVGQTILIGHSFGAWLALLFAARYPQRVSKVILIGCGPLEQRYLPELIRTREERKNAGVENTDNYRPLPGSGGDMLYFDEEQHMALMKEAMTLRENGQLLAYARQVECPIVAFHGNYDPHPVKGIGEPMKDKRNFRLIPMERCGHDPWKETWAREPFFEKICAELRKQA